MSSNNNMIEITVANEDGITIPLTVSATSFVGELKPLIFNAIGIPIFEQTILHEGKQLFDLTALSAAKIKSGDILFVVQGSSAPLPQAIPSPSQSYRSQAESIKQHFLSDQSSLQQLLHNDPVLAEAILSDNMDLLTSLVKERIEEKNRKRLEEENRIQQLNANYLDPEIQKKIEEEIRMGNVNENMHAAMEHNPESFGRVVMLYIDCHVNNIPVKAFVDSGAQITLMSSKCAERCGIMRLLDRRYATTLVGVGTSQALGRVHVCTIKIGNSFYNSSFTIVDDDRVEFLLGLDMLRKHQCIIDLPANCLRLGNGEDSVPFLSEKDIPKHFLGNLSSSLDDLPIVNIDNNDNNNNNSNKPEDSGNLNINNNPINNNNDNNLLSSNIIDRSGSNNIIINPPQANNTNEEAIKLIMGMGYTREQAIEALSMCGGNADAALSILMFQ